MTQRPSLPPDSPAFRGKGGAPTFRPPPISRLGTRVGAQVAAGELVATADVLAVVELRLRAATPSGGWVLDGAPRTITQARALDGMLMVMDAAVDRVVALDVPEAEVRVRLARRARTERRADDTTDVIAHRLAVWAREGACVLAWYDRRGLLVRVDGTGDVADVEARVAGALEPSRRVNEVLALQDDGASASEPGVDGCGAQPHRMH